VRVGRRIRGRVRSRPSADEFIIIILTPKAWLIIVIVIVIVIIVITHLVI